MAKYNEILVGRYNRALQKLLGMKGQVPAPQLTSEITPVFQFPLGVEFRYLESWERFGFNQNVVGVAAKVALIQLRNPAGSNLIAVLEKISFHNANVGVDGFVFSSGAKAVDLTTVLTSANTRFDPRGRPTPTVLVSTDNLAAPVDLQTRDAGNLLANTPYDSIFDENQEVPLLPGDAALFRNTTLGSGLQLTLWWRERFLEESERT